MSRIPFLSLLLFTIGVFFASAGAYSQHLDHNFSAEKREESSFKIQLLRHGMIGASSLQHLDLSAEVLRFGLLARGGSNWTFTIFSTQTIWRGNKTEVLNTFDFLMNPLGGLLNGNFSGIIPFTLKPKKNTNLKFNLGSKWIEGPPAASFRTSRFFDYYFQLGGLYQQLLAEDPLTNSSLSVSLSPYFQMHHTSADSRRRFFDGALPSLAQGYGLEIGLDYNRQLKLSLYGQQILNSPKTSELNRFIARLIMAYRF